MSLSTQTSYELNGACIQIDAASQFLPCIYLPVCPLRRIPSWTLALILVAIWIHTVADWLSLLLKKSESFILSCTVRILMALLASQIEGAPW